MKLSHKLKEQQRTGLKYDELIAEVEKLEEELSKQLRWREAFNEKKFFLIVEEAEATRIERDIWKKACELASCLDEFNGHLKQEETALYWYEQAKQLLEKRE